MRTQIRAHLSCTSPTPKCSDYRSTLPLSPAFHAACSKGELIKGPFKWLPFQSYYFPITKGEQIKISSLICCFPLLLIGVLLEPSKRAHPIFPVSHRVVILGLMAVTLDCSTTHAQFFFRERSETSQSPNPLSNNSCHKEPVTLPPSEKCFEAALERRASSLQPVQCWMQQQNFTERGGNSNLSEQKETHELFILQTETQLRTSG